MAASRMMPTLKVVPPMSAATMLSMPLSRPMKWQAATPAAGPDSMVPTAFRTESSTPSTPP